MTFRAALLFVLVTAAAVLTGVWVPTPKANPSTGGLPAASKVAIIGVQHAGWDDLSSLPDAAFGNVSVRPEKAEPSNVVEGWAAIASGARWDLPTTGDNDPLHAKHDVPGTYRIGRLVEAAKAKGSCVTAGSNLQDTGSALLTLDAQGTATSLSPAQPFPSADTALSSTCAVAIVDVGALDPPVNGSARVRDVLPNLVTRAQAQGRTVIVVSLADNGRMDLHPAAIIAPGFGGKSLSSGSTRRAGYIQLVDLPTTVATILDVPAPDDTEGASITLADSGPDVADLKDLITSARESHRTTPLVITALLAVGVAGVGIAGRRRFGALLFMGSMPAATFLSAAQPLRGYVLIPIILGLSALIAWCGNTPRGVGLATAWVIGADVLLGARWQLDSPLGYSPVVAGRFAGIGNLAFGVLAAATILAMHRRSKPVAALLLLGAVAIDGAPFWGSDLGGTLALVTAGLVMLGVRGKRLILGGLAAVAVATAFALLDLTRPAEDRTHLGRFAQKVKDGDAWEVIHRKLVAAIDLVGHSPLTMLALVVALVALVFANLRAGDGPHAPAIRALSVAGVLGFFLNDSGLAAAITLVWVAVPLISAATRPPSVSRVARRVLL